MSHHEAENIAIAVGKRLTEQDALAKAYGIELEEIRPGYARLGMTVNNTMVGPHGVCRGVFTYALGDTACGFAANSWNLNTMAVGVDTFYLATAALGERLTAEARETGTVGRNAIYDVTISDRKGRLIVVLRCQCRLAKGRIVDDLPALRGDAA